MVGFEVLIKSHICYLYWKDTKKVLLELDDSYCSVFLDSTVALLHVFSFPAAVSSTMLYNVLNFPAGVVPVTTVTEDDEEELQQYQGQYGDPWDKKLKKVCLD